MSQPPPKKRPKQHHWPPVSQICHPVSQIWPDNGDTIPNKVYGKITVHSSVAHQLQEMLKPDEIAQGRVFRRVTFQVPKSALRDIFMPSEEGVALTVHPKTAVLERSAEMVGFWQISKYWSIDFDRRIAMDWERHWTTKPNEEGRVEPRGGSEAPAHTVSISTQRCTKFGNTFLTCISGFMSWLEQFKGRQLDISMLDLSRIGAPVLAHPDNSHPVLFRDSYGSRRLYPASSGKNLKVIMQVLDGYVTHTDAKILEDTILPLVISQTPTLRRLVILDRLPKRSTQSENQAYIHSMDDLSSKEMKYRLKRPGVCAFIRKSTVKKLWRQCRRHSLKPAIPGHVEHKSLCHKLDVRTVLSDLRWDRVIVCSSLPDPIRLPIGHNIGFWWTLCTPSMVVQCKAPLSFTKIAPHGWEHKDALLLLNRHRMIDLTSIPQ